MSWLSPNFSCWLVVSLLVVAGRLLRESAMLGGWEASLCPRGVRCFSRPASGPGGKSTYLHKPWRLSATIFYDLAIPCPLAAPFFPGESESHTPRNSPSCFPLRKAGKKTQLPSPRPLNPIDHVAGQPVSGTFGMNKRRACQGPFRPSEAKQNP